MDSSPELRAKLEKLNASRAKTLADSLGIEIMTLEGDSLSARMPVDQRTVQPEGLLHGGASVALAETLDSIGGWLQVEQQGKTVVGQEINANHIRPVRSGWVTGTAVPLHLGKTSQVWQIEICNEQQKLVCISR